MTNENPTDKAENIENTLDSRGEIVYLYDAADTNPNGDPLTEENRPRTDRYNDEALVTDVRLKRVVRDYIEHVGHTIFIKASGDEGRDDKDDRYEVLMEEMEPLMDENGPNLTEEEAFFAVATDIRLFGEAMTFDSPVDGNRTGPVQFNIGRSMHEVNETGHGKTSVVAASSDEDDRTEGGNMFTDHRIDYALMRFHSLINEHNAAETYCGEDDIELLEDGLWDGTKNETITSSKMGHHPRLLIRVQYDTDNYQIGDLHRSFTFEPDGMDEKAVRDITDGHVNADEFINLINGRADHIDSVHVRASRRLQIRVGDVEDGNAYDLEQELNDALGADSVEFSVE